MRDVTSALQTAQQSRNRYPLARLTVRDLRLRFASFTTQSNPWSAVDDEDLATAEPGGGVQGDQLTTPAGTILRAAGTTAIYVNRVTTPSTASQWGTWTNISVAKDSGTQVGLGAGPGVIYLVYVRVAILRYRISSDDGLTWSSEQSTGITCYAPVGLALANANTIVTFEALDGALQVNNVMRIRIIRNSGGWTASQMPWFVIGEDIDTNLTPLTADMVNSCTFFSAFTAPGDSEGTFIIYSRHQTGEAWVTRVSYDGVWSNPKPIVTPDYTKFYPYRAASIQGKVWLTGRITRDNGSGYNPEFDCYLTSTDGWNWSVLARDSYIGDAELRGKIHCVSGPYVYYSGIYTVLRAPASYLIDPVTDPVAYLTTSDDLLSADISYPAAGTAPEATVDLATEDDNYIDGAAADIVKPGSEVWLEAGYKTTAGDEYVQLFRGSIDSPPTAVEDGGRQASFTARDSAFKALRDYVSPLYWDILSQRKHFDDCELMDRLAIQSGTWETAGANLIANPGFETGLAGWTDYATGSAGGTRAQSTEEKQAGKYSYRLEKTSGSEDSDWGATTTFQVEAGKTYIVSVWHRCTAISGVNHEYLVQVNGNYGAAGVSVYQTNAYDEAQSFWDESVLTINAEASAMVTLRVALSDCAAGTLYVDDVSVRDQAPGYFSFTGFEGTEEGVLLFPDTELADFDIRMLVEDSAGTQANQVSLGLIGLWQDEDNFFVLHFARASGSKYVQLWRKTLGVWKRLASVSSTWAVNGKFYLRLVHRQGHFTGYAKSQGDTNWGAPVIDYSLTALIRPQPAFKGKVGVRLSIIPLRFHAQGLDAYSKQVALRVANDLDWANFPRADRLIIDNEQIDFAGKSGMSAVGSSGLLSGFTATGCQLTLASSTDQWNGGVLTFLPPNSEAFANWLIADTTPSGALTEFVLDDANSGHVNTNGLSSGAASQHCGGIAYTEITARPSGGLISCTRGVNNTDADRHADNTLAYLFADDELRLHSFEVYDYEPDWCIEDLLLHMARLAGVAGCDFNDAGVIPTGTITPGAGAWGTALWYGNFDSRDFDARANVNSATWKAGASKIGFFCRSEARATNTARALIVGIWYDATDYWAFISRKNGSTETLLQKVKLEQVPDDVFALRLVAHDDFFTLYVDRALVMTFRESTYNNYTNFNFAGVNAFSKATTFTATRIPELWEWVEFAQINPGEQLQGAISRLLQNRPVYQISRGNGRLKFSGFDQRDDLGSFADSIFSDRTASEDSEWNTFLRVESEDVIEQIDEALAREHGLLFRTYNMTQTSTPQAVAMLAQLLRRMQEVVYGRSQEQTANLAFENEDRFTAAYVAAGTGLTVSESLIVNDVHYTFQGVSFGMQVGARKLVS
jgi:hypothetical protein